MHAPTTVHRSMTRPLRAALDEAPMTRFQWSAVSVCVLLNMLDGFDVLVMAFTGRTVATERGLSGAQLAGVLLLGTAAVLTQLRVPAPAASPAIPEGVTR